MTSDDSAEAIRARMADLRRDLTSDVHEVGRTARQMANPLYFIRRYPWATAAAAAAVGYLLVPKKKQQVFKPDPEMLAELLRNQNIKVDTSKTSSETAGMFKSLAVMGLTWAAKTGMNYAVQQITAAAMNKAQANPEPSAAAPSPADEPWETTR